MVLPNQYGVPFPLRAVGADGVRDGTVSRPLPPLPPGVDWLRHEHTVEHTPVVLDVGCTGYGEIMATETSEGEFPAPCRACGSGTGRRESRGWICFTCGWRVGDVPDADLPPVRVEVVYYLRFADRIKIGTSGNPRSRLAQLRFDELLAFERGGRAIEQKRHVQFAEQRFPGSEWFHSHRALTDHVDSLAAGVEDPWDLYRRWMSEQLALRT
ncbi:MAG: hypothetical protein QOD50_1010 [Actinomycetota bacterium]|nr:hypothetical protein [Actinomycetota bacterium]